MHNPDLPSCFFGHLTLQLKEYTFNKHFYVKPVLYAVSGVVNSFEKKNFED